MVKYLTNRSKKVYSGGQRKPKHQAQRFEIYRLARPFMENRPGRYRPENRHPKPTEQANQPDNTQPLQGRSEGRESLQGPTTVDKSEQPKPQQERRANNLLGEKKGERGNLGRAVFNCITPSFMDGADLVLIRRLLYDKNITQEDAQRMEQKWRESIETMDRQSLETELKSSENRLENHKEDIAKSGGTPLSRALFSALEEEVDVLRGVRHQRFSEKGHN